MPQLFLPIWILRKKKKKKKIPLTLETPVTEPLFSLPGPVPILRTNETIHLRVAPSLSQTAIPPEVCRTALNERIVILEINPKTMKKYLHFIALSDFLKRKHSLNVESKIILSLHFPYSCSFRVYMPSLKPHFCLTQITPV